MRMLQHLAPAILGRNLDGIIERMEMNAAPISIRHDVSPEPADVNLPKETPPDYRTIETTALVHFISARTIARGYTQFQEGDAIVTFDTQQSFTGLRHVVFTMPDGKEYVQATEGTDALHEFWDVLVGGTKLSVTLLLRIRK